MGRLVKVPISSSRHSSISKNKRLIFSIVLLSCYNLPSPPGVVDTLSFECYPKTEIVSHAYNEVFIEYVLHLSWRFDK